MREEKAKLDCQQRLAHQDLLLRKDLDATGLSELYRKLSAASQVLLPPLSTHHHLVTSLTAPFSGDRARVYACRRMLLARHGRFGSISDTSCLSSADRVQFLQVTVQEGAKSVDAAHADAMNMRNRQYQKLHGDFQKLSADFAAKRQLASSQAAQLLQLQVLRCARLHLSATHVTLQE